MVCPQNLIRLLHYKSNVKLITPIDLQTKRPTVNRMIDIAYDTIVSNSKHVKHSNMTTTRNRIKLCV